MKVTKSTNKKFNNEAIEMVLYYDAKSIDSPVRLYNYRIEGKTNGVELFIDDNVGSSMFSVFCRFDKCNELTGRMNSKHNFHTQSPCDVAIIEFSYFLDELVSYI